MSDDRADRSGAADVGHGWSFEETSRRQRVVGVELAPLDRLRWLERTLAEATRMRGRAEATSGVGVVAEGVPGPADGRDPD